MAEDHHSTEDSPTLVKTRPVPRGVLNRGVEQGIYALERRVPDDEAVAYFVEHFWGVRWNVDEPYVSETLPYPSVHAVIERGRSEVVGVMEGKFTRVLTGSGAVVGIKFRPGAFHPFLGAAVRTITNRRLPFDDVFGIDPAALEAQVFATDDFDDAVCTATAFLRARLPARDPSIERAAAVVDVAATDRSIIRVAQLEAIAGMTARALQRLFAEYVGVSPKWVINRYRLHEAAERLAAGTSDVTTIAHELGYFDHAHFAKEFKAVVGEVPAAFARRLETR